jgi:hypothetical protein
MMKKKSKIIRVSLSRGSAENRAYMSTLSPLMDEIVFRGLKTRKTLSPEALNLDSEGPSPESGSYPAILSEPSADPDKD